MEWAISREELKETTKSIRYGLHQKWSTAPMLHFFSLMNQMLDIPNTEYICVCRFPSIVIRFDHLVQKKIHFTSIELNWIGLDSMGVHNYKYVYNTRVHIISIDASVKHSIFFCCSGCCCFVRFVCLMVFMVKRETCNSIIGICVFLLLYIKNPNAIIDGENGLYRKKIILFSCFCILLLCMVCFDGRARICL